MSGAGGSLVAARLRRARPQLEGTVLLPRELRLDRRRRQRRRPHAFRAIEPLRMTAVGRGAPPHRWEGHGAPVDRHLRRRKDGALRPHVLGDGRPVGRALRTPDDICWRGRSRAREAGRTGATPRPRRAASRVRARLRRRRATRRSPSLRGMRRAERAWCRGPARRPVGRHKFEGRNLRDGTASSVRVRSACGRAGGRPPGGFCARGAGAAKG